ncbi:MAG TPA: hypothetical protein VEY71_07575 [Chitinophagales bacterium]|nr:hypothetical protein [Chitinophagales bacterium]
MKTSRNPNGGDRLTSTTGTSFANASSSSSVIHHLKRETAFTTDHRKNDVYMPTVNRIHYRKRTA